MAYKMLKYDYDRDRALYTNIYDDVYPENNDL